VGQQTTWKTRKTNINNRERYSKRLYKNQNGTKLDRTQIVDEGTQKALAERPKPKEEKENNESSNNAGKKGSLAEVQKMLSVKQGGGQVVKRRGKKGENQQRTKNLKNKKGGKGRRSSKGHRQQANRLARERQGKGAGMTCRRLEERWQKNLNRETVQESELNKEV